MSLILIKTVGAESVWVMELIFNRARIAIGPTNEQRFRDTW